EGPEWYADQGQRARPATAQVAPSTNPATTQATTSSTTGRTLTTSPVQGGTWRARGDEKGTAPVTLGSGAADDKNFVMALDIFRKGAAIDSVVLNQFRKTAEDPNARYSFQEPLRVDGNVRDDTRSLETRSINIDGNDVDLA